MIQEMVPLVQRLEQDVERLEGYHSTASDRGMRDAEIKLRAASGRIRSVMAAVQRVTDAERLPHADNDDDAQVPPYLPAYAVRVSRTRSAPSALHNSPVTASRFTSNPLPLPRSGPSASDGVRSWTAATWRLPSSAVTCSPVPPPPPTHNAWRASSEWRATRRMCRRSRRWCCCLWCTPRCSSPCRWALHLGALLASVQQLPCTSPI